MTIIEGLDNMRKSIKECSKCKLGKIEGRIVICGQGNKENPRVMFAGQNPSWKAEKDEILIGDGKSMERIFTSALKAAGIPIEKCYTTNIVKCSTERNAAPAFSDVKVCREYLEKEIELLKPSIICTVGKVATTGLFGSFIRSEFNFSYGYQARIFSIPHPMYAVYRNMGVEKYASYFLPIAKEIKKELISESTQQTMKDFIKGVS